MTTYNVVFSYSVTIEADDENEAEDKAWEQYGSETLDSGEFHSSWFQVRAKDMACHVEEREEI